MQPPASGDTWLGLAEDQLPVATAYDWAVRPHCGAVVLFSGTVRDHAEGRDGVEHLTYEAYSEQVLARFTAIADEIRVRWPSVGRIVVLHRIGQLSVGESSVVVAVSAAHRPEAFAAARFGIDAVKETAPIWKHEVWSEGAAWGLGAHTVREASDVESSG